MILGLIGLLPATLGPDAAEALEAEVRSTGTVRPPGLPQMAFAPDRDLLFDHGPPLPGHANGLAFHAFDATGSEVLARTYYSIGGGFVVEAAGLSSARSDTLPADCPYPFRTAAEMPETGRARGLSIAEMKRANEDAVGGPGLDARPDAIRDVVFACIDRAHDSACIQGGVHTRPV